MDLKTNFGGRTQDEEAVRREKDECNGGGGGFTSIQKKTDFLN